jgi:hypothetical protein
MLALFLFVAATLNAQHDQKITTFDVPNSSYTFPTAISTSGEIVGYYYDSGRFQRAFLRKSNGAITTLNFPKPGAVPTAVSGGQIAGYYDYLADKPQLDGPPFLAGFIRRANGEFTSIIPNVEWNAIPRAINPAGEVVAATST